MNPPLHGTIKALGWNEAEVSKPSLSQNCGQRADQRESEAAEPEKVYRHGSVWEYRAGVIDSSMGECGRNVCQKIQLRVRLKTACAGDHERGYHPREETGL